VAFDIPVTQARSDLAELVNRVAYSGERVVLTRHGKPLAALVSPADLERLEQLEGERIDLTSTGYREDQSAPGEPMRIAAQYRPPGPGRHRPGFH
jgi:prevent-host-death family protein